jgi:hypothetical protein
MFPYPPHPDIDTSTWGEGPWRHEPAAKAWVEGRTGLNCAIIRNPVVGNLCGYVAVEPGHPLHGKKYNDRIALPPVIGEREIVMGRDVGIISMLCDAFDHSQDGMVSVGVVLPAHGGITFSAGDTDDFWWFGFDCAHLDDMAPGVVAMSKSIGIEHPAMEHGTYRDYDYVEGHVTRLAWALHEFRTLLAQQRAIEDDA